MSSGDGRIIGYSIAGLCYGTYLFFSGFSKFREKLLIENTPTSKIRSIAMGRVEVFGKVIADRNNVAEGPFSGDTCVHCWWTVEELRSSGKSSKWVVISQGYIGGPFFIKDNTGTVLVDPDGARMDIPMDHEYMLSKKGPTGRIIEFLTGRGISYKGLIFNKELRLREYYLAPGDKVFVMGVAGKNPFADPDRASLNEEGVMIQKGKHKEFYYIADKDEKEVLKKMGWQVIIGFFGGAALMIVCLFIIFAYFRIL
ncbi:MAG: hypothetical protein HGA85_01675 [Nanoarchaeota archaeon]|nr:hypothetical protein [Nanoarchaeota archaeon]